MANLILPSLEIQNFRAFEHLRIERLGRVNLITGKNNVGKTSLLEALYLYARGGTPYMLREILAMRQELYLSDSVILRSRLGTSEEFNYLPNLKHLFHGRKSVYDSINAFRIGPLNLPQASLSISLEWFQEVDRAGTGGIGRPARRLIPVPFAERTSAIEALPYIVSQMGLQPEFRISLERAIEGTPFLSAEPKGWPCQFIKPNGIDNLQIGTLWDRVALTAFEDTVVDGLRLIHPGIDRISVVSEQNSASDRLPIVRVIGESDRIPLRSLGDGMNRLLGIILALNQSEDGILLIDEVETGLHYSVMPDVWKLIFQVAERLNVQVFATTHSWDCIEAFQQAAAEDEHEEAVLIRLENRNGSVAATLFDERKLDIATRELIEVR